jgi:hypothetical protein
MATADKPARFDPDALNLSPKPDEDHGAIPLRETTGAADPVINQLTSSNEVGGLVSDEDIASLGSDLARVMQEEGYHPVVIFGTNNSGKTSILMSLFSTIMTEPSLKTGLSLCDPILGASNPVGARLHEDAEHTFNVKTQAFLAQEKIPRTTVELPFFIPVEFRPGDGKTPVKFAFLESNGEWYRPLISDGTRIGDSERLFPALRSEIENFIANFQNGMTFIYVAPVTQIEVYAKPDQLNDEREIGYASLAIKGVLQSYDRIRANGRSRDRHMLLLSKWDANSRRAADRAEGISASPGEIIEFCHKRYAQALATLQGLNLRDDQRNVNAYCSGMINERGLLSLKPDDPVRGVIASYPVRLWTYLYKNALLASGLESASPFPEPRRKSSLMTTFHSFLDRISG